MFTNLQAHTFSSIRTRNHTHTYTRSQTYRHPHSHPPLICQAVGQPSPFSSRRKLSAGGDLYPNSSGAAYVMTFPAATPNKEASLGAALLCPAHCAPVRLKFTS